ncbi:glucosaminidase domain-containing protein, partial [Prevotella histicola]|nr:glucosaminidase domain-containing protein [Prevotella histicola]
MAISPSEFINRYAPYAMEQQVKYGIPSSVILAQMAVESTWGSS